MADFRVYVPHSLRGSNDFVFLTLVRGDQAVAHGCVYRPEGAVAFDTEPLPFNEAWAQANGFADKHGVEAVHVR